MTNWLQRFSFLGVPLLLAGLFGSSLTHGWPTLALGFLSGVGLVLWFVARDSGFSHKNQLANALMALVYAALWAAVVSANEVARLTHMGRPAIIGGALLMLTVWGITDWFLRKREQRSGRPAPTES